MTTRQLRAEVERLQAEVARLEADAEMLWKSIAEKNKEILRLRAVIKAVREPTKKMIDAAFDHPDQMDHQQSDVNAFVRQWKTAIDVALK